MQHHTLNLLFHLILFFPVIPFLSQVQFTSSFSLLCPALFRIIISKAPPQFFCTSFFICPAPNSSALFPFLTTDFCPGLPSCSFYVQQLCSIKSFIIWYSIYLKSDSQVLINSRSSRVQKNLHNPTEISCFFSAKRKSYK